MLIDLKERYGETAKLGELPDAWKRPSSWPAKEMRLP